MILNIFFLQLDLGDGLKPPGYYVRRSCGLYPAPLPQDHPHTDHAERLFHFMGIFFAKCIQDNRLVDIPLSHPFLKLMCMGDVVDNVSQSYRELLCRVESPDDFSSLIDDDLTPTEDINKELGLDRSKAHFEMSLSVLSTSTTNSDAPWYAGLLTQEDFELIDSHRARFLAQLKDIVAHKQAIVNDVKLSDEEKKSKLEFLTLSNPPVKLEDLR